MGKRDRPLTDARFSGVSTGACIGHIGPEAQAGGPIGKILDGDWIEIHIDRSAITGHVNLVGHGEIVADAAWGAKELQSRVIGSFEPHPELPDDTRLWAALQNAGGGTWGGCVYDVEEILKKLGR